MKKSARFNYIILLYLSGIVVFTLFRVAETLVYCSLVTVQGVTGSLYLTALWKGFRFDTAVSTYILALPLLLIVIGELARIRKSWYYATAHYIAMVLYTVAFFACAADIPYFCYFFQRLDAQVLTMNESMPVVIDMIFSEPTYLLYFFVFLVVAVGWWFLGRLIYRRVLKAHLGSEMPYKWAIPMAAVLLLGWFTGMRGHLTDKPPLRAEHAVFCSNSYLNQIGLNPVFTFLKSAGAIMNDRNHPIELIDPETAREVYESREDKAASGGILLPNNTHVVVVIMESMATEKTMLGSHPEASLTPCLDSLMHLGITFTQAWSAGTQTYNGVYSTLYGHPAIFKRHTMHGSSTVPRMWGLPQNMQCSGYSTAFFMAHQGYFDGMESFLYSNGYDKVFEQNSYPEEEWVNSYGVPDHVLFGHAIDYLNEALKYAQKLPFYYYHTSMSGVNFDMQKFLEAADGKIKNLAGVKFNYPDLYMFQRCLRACGCKYDITWGIDEWFAGAVALGAKSAIGSTYNYAAGIYYKIWDAVKRGDLKASEKGMKKVCDVVDILVEYGGVAGGKAMCAVWGVDLGTVRQPLKALTDAEKKAIVARLKKIGYK